jgi:YVTN family beta-propeller protein
MKRLTTITGRISPKSVVCSGRGLAFAQNMMYTHTVTVYDRAFRLVATIPDRVRLADFGIRGYEGTHLGSPVECAFTPDGRYAWVSNYQMYGKGFSRPGNDDAEAKPGVFDDSFVYRIDTATRKIDRVVKAGAVPKYVAVTPDARHVLVSNWCSSDLTVIDAATCRPVRRVPLGRHPRGIAADPTTGRVYVAVMGTPDIAVLDSADFSAPVRWIRNVGEAPRHLCIEPDGSALYVTLNREGRVVKVDPKAGKVVKGVTTGRAPRSMTLGDGFLYVVNYESNTVSKVRTADLKVVENVTTNRHPIGISYDAPERRVWIACYSGCLHVYAAD